MQRDDTPDEAVMVKSQAQKPTTDFRVLYGISSPALQLHIKDRIFHVAQLQCPKASSSAQLTGVL